MAVCVCAELLRKPGTVCGVEALGLGHPLKFINIKQQWCSPSERMSLLRGTGKDCPATTALGLSASIELLATYR